MTLPTAVDPIPIVWVINSSGLKTAELYPAPVNLKAYTALAFSDINN